MKKFLFLVLALGLIGGDDRGASAQTQDEIVNVFAGAWRVYDFEYVSGGPCTIALTRNTIAEAFEADKAYCGGGLEKVAAWGIDRGQLVLLDQGFQPIARLGGNQNRISGAVSDGRMLILERTKPGDPEPRTPDCLFVGYSQECAVGPDRLPPTIGAGGVARVEVLVNLVARDQPRPDASALTTIERGSCLAVSECRLASDGPWCRSTIQGAEVWTRQHAIRLGEFPVLTYRQGRTGACAQSAQFVRSN